LSKKKKGKPTTPIVHGGGTGGLEEPPNGHIDCNQAQRNPYEKINTVVACVGLFVLILYTSFSGCMSCEMVKANHLAAQNFAVSERPYIVLGRKDGTIADFAVPKDWTNPRAAVGLIIYFQNTGHLPALHADIGVTMTALIPPTGNKPPIDPPERSRGEFYRARNKKGEMNWLQGESSIGGASEFLLPLANELSKADYDIIQQGHTVYMVIGAVRYCDDFGDYTCNEFTLFFEGDPFDKFRVINDEPCLIYGYPPRRADMEYLTPCEQPEERAAREKEEREEIAKKAAEASVIAPAASPSPTP
jgi:hypothetical protein